MTIIWITMPPFTGRDYILWQNTCENFFRWPCEKKPPFFFPYFQASSPTMDRDPPCTAKEPESDGCDRNGPRPTGKSFPFDPPFECPNPETAILSKSCKIDVCIQMAAKRSAGYGKIDLIYVGDELDGMGNPGLDIMDDPPLGRYLKAHFLWCAHIDHRLSLGERCDDSSFLGFDPIIFLNHPKIPKKADEAAEAIAATFDFAAIAIEDPHLEIGGSFRRKAQENDSIGADPELPVA